MASSLSNLVNNLSEGICRVKYKFVLDYKKCETCGTKYKYCDCFLEYANFIHERLTNNKYMKDYNKNKELSYIQYWDVNNLYGWTMS